MKKTNKEHMIGINKIFDKWVWKARGQVLKKDGSTGQRIGEWREKIN